MVGRAGVADEEGFSAAVEAITSAFGDATRRGIYLYVRDNGGVSAGEVAEHFDLHPNVARHHLDKLAAGGHLQVFLDHASSVGRPSKRYKARLDDRSAVPAHRDDLLVLLLARLLPLVDPVAAEQAAHEVGEEYGRKLGMEMAPGDASRSVRSAMQSVADALTAHGFAAHASRSPTDGNTVVRGHCPFGTAALENPVLCAADRGLVEGLLSVLCGDTVTVKLSSRAKGDDGCVTVAG